MRGSLRRGGLAAVAALLLLLLTACGGLATGTAAKPSPTPSSTSSIEGESIDELPTVPAATATPTPAAAPTPSEEQFATAVFDDVQAMWAQEFSTAGIPYRPARLILFTTQVATACGTEMADVGPFYCPGDDGVYIDLSFLTLLQRAIGAEGDFARAYIIAHEVGHHVQNLLGISGRAAALQEQHPTQANAISVRVELQADCLAGVWTHSTYQRGLITDGVFQQAVRAAAAVGDDLQQQLSGGQVESENWTHGSSAQRVEWLERGFNSGSADSCDTFSAASA